MISVADTLCGASKRSRCINAAIRQSVARLKKQGFQTHALAAADAGETKLLARRDRIEVKIEVNFVMRGTVHPVRSRR